jgi:ferritin-like metal-binding protein YciE
MKGLTCINEFLAFHLEGMYDGEKKLQRYLPAISVVVRHKGLKEEIDQYVARAAEKRSKLKRIFGYVLVPPFKRKNKVIETLIKEVLEALEQASGDAVQDAVITAFVQSINHYNIANYNIALAFAVELNLDVVADLLHEILEWEKKTDTSLTKIAFEELRQNESSSTI